MIAKKRMKAHTTGDIEEDLSYVPDVRQRLEGIQPFLNDDP